MGGADGVAVKWDGRVGAERARDLLHERVGPSKTSGGGRGAGRLSQTLTSGDLVPVTNGSEYIRDMKLKFLTFLLHERCLSSYGCVDQP